MRLGLFETEVTLMCLNANHQERNKSSVYCISLFHVRQIILCFIKTLIYNNLLFIDLFCLLFTSFATRLFIISIKEWGMH